MLTPATIDTLAQRLDEAQRRGAHTDSLAATTDFDIADAYAIQHKVVELRTSRGEQLIGVKLGFTSQAKMAQMGISEVIVGHLTDSMHIADGGTVNLGSFIHPKAEPEVAYRLAHDVDLTQPHVDLASAVDAVAPALEIIDSRYRNFQFTYTDVVADNTSAAAFVLGAWRPLQPIPNSAVRFRVGAAESVGSTAAILGDPIRALPALADVCRRRDITLKAGHIILAGAATAALPLTAGTIECDVAGLGSVSALAVTS